VLKLISDGLWPAVRRKAQGAGLRKAAVAYVTNPELLPLGPGDLLVTDASNASIASGRTSAMALKQYFESGVELISLPDLHAKVLVLDDWAVIGSANVSRHSALVYFEAAVLSDRPELVGQADKLVSALAEEGEPITQRFLDRILKIPVPRTPRAVGSRLARKRNRDLSEPTFWFLSLHSGKAYPGDSEAVEDAARAISRKLGKKAGIVDWFWWSLDARFQKGDIVLECVRPKQKVSTTRSVRVYMHSRVVGTLAEPGVKAKTIHCLSRHDSDETSLSWSAFQQLLKKGGVTRKLAYNRTAELTADESSALFEIWPGRRNA
jgi:hypothetical protein